MSYTLGNLPLAYLLMLIPVFASGVLWLGVFLRRESYRRRFRSWRLAWEMWLSSLLLTALLFGGGYWYLFWQPFYGITIQPDGAWSLRYALPDRSVAVAPAEIRSLTIEDDWLPIRSANPRVILQIQLQAGRLFTSAPLPQTEAAQFLQELSRQLTLAAGQP